MIDADDVCIGSRRVGGFAPPYIIAEAGVNHDGDLHRAKRLIDAAAGAGADAVKFQCFSADRLAAADAPSCRYQVEHNGAGASQREMLRRLELSAAAFAELKRHADAASIDFIATPFDVDAVRTLAGMGVPAIKIASPDLVNVPLLRAAAETGLPLIVSTGASTADEIAASVALLRRHGAGDRLILLHCVSAYPTPVDAAHLHTIRDLSMRHRVPVGFSDHTMSATFSGLAVAAGAAVLEKHVTLDRGASGPDHFFSLEPDDLARYVGTARAAHRVMGRPRDDVVADEHEVRECARGRIIAARRIAAGGVLEGTDLAVQRPGLGISPFRWDEVLGRRTTTDIAPDTPLAWSMLA